MWIACHVKCEPRNEWVCKDDLRSHEYVSGNERFIRLRCCNCGAEDEIPCSAWNALLEQEKNEARRYRRAGLTKYPRIEPQSGKWVNSREDEKRVWRALGYHEAPHGVDESTWTETDYRVKDYYTKREPGWRNLKAQALAGKIKID